MERMGLSSLYFVRGISGDQLSSIGFACRENKEVVWRLYRSFGRVT
jgi:hypothetical protein